MVGAEGDMHPETAAERPDDGRQTGEGEVAGIEMGEGTGKGADPCSETAPSALPLSDGTSPLLEEVVGLSR